MRVVSPRIAIAVERYGATGEHQFCELVHRQIRSLSRAINREQPKRQEANTIQATVHVSEQFAADLCTSVWAYRAKHVVGLLPRNVRVDAIHTARRRENKLDDASVSCEVEQVLCPTYIDTLKFTWRQDRGSHAGFGREVKDGVVGIRKCLWQYRFIADITLDEPKMAIRQTSPDVLPLDGRIVGAVEIIDARHPPAVVQQLIAKMATYKTGTAGDESMSGMHFLNAEQMNRPVALSASAGVPDVPRPLAGATAPSESQKRPTDVLPTASVR